MKNQIAIQYKPINLFVLLIAAHAIITLHELAHYIVDYLQGETGGITLVTSYTVSGVNSPLSNIMGPLSNLIMSWAALLFALWVKQNDLKLIGIGITILNAISRPFIYFLSLFLGFNGNDETVFSAALHIPLWATILTMTFLFSIPFTLAIRALHGSLRQKLIFTGIMLAFAFAAVVSFQLLDPIVFPARYE